MKKLVQKYIKYREKRTAILKEKKPKTFKEYCITTFKSVVFSLVVVLMLQSVLLSSMMVPTSSMENTVMVGDFLLVHRLFGPSTPQLIPFLNMPLPYVMLPSIKDPQKGDPIVFIFPGNRDEIKSSEFTYYLKRCVAEPGDTLQVIDNIVYVNNIKLPIPPDAKYDKNKNNLVEIDYTFPKSKEWTTTNYGPIVIPKKGDTIYINNELDYYDWKIFIEREGHNIYWVGEPEIDGEITNIYIVKENYYFGMGDNRDNSLDSRFWGFIPRKHILGSPIVCWLSWEMHDEFGLERNILEKISNIRFAKMFRIIN